MSSFPESNGRNEPLEHVRHKPVHTLPSDCELVIVSPQLRSNINLSRIARSAGCSGVRKMYIGGNGRIDPKIARDSAKTIQFVHRRSLPPVLKELRKLGFCLVGLEQTSHSTVIYDHVFQPRTALIIGHERHGITDEVLKLLDVSIEIPVFGLPYSFNVATATSMALYEFGRQYFQPS